MKGFQLFFESFKAQLNCKHDAIVAVAHFMLINEDFVCVGTGCEVTEVDEHGGSELLPAGWNANKNVYSLKYRSRSGHTVVTLQGNKVDEKFTLSVSAWHYPETVTLSIQADKYLTAKWNSNYSEAFVSGEVKPLEDLLRRELFSKLPDHEKSLITLHACKCFPAGAGPDGQRHLRGICAAPEPVPVLTEDGLNVIPPVGGTDVEPMSCAQGNPPQCDPFNPDNRSSTFPDRRNDQQQTAPPSACKSNPSDLPKEQGPKTGGP